MGVIDKFGGRYEFLSNFYNCIIEFEGIVYTSSEAAFQASKTLDMNERRKIAQMSASKSKRYCGRHGKLVLRSDWESIKDDVMYRVVKAKFSQNEDLKKKLLATGNAELVEGTTWHDNYWGNCTCDRCKGIIAKNMLGNILMRVRSELSKEAI